MENTRVGTGAEMDLGYIAFLVGIVLATIGTGAIVRRLRIADRIEPHRRVVAVALLGIGGVVALVLNLEGGEFAVRGDSLRMVLTFFFAIVSITGLVLVRDSRSLR